MMWVFDGHVPEDPVMPGTMLVEGLLQLAGFFGGYVGGRGKGRAARVDDVKFLAEVTPQDEEIMYRIDVRKHSADHKLLVAEGRVIARGIHRTTVGKYACSRRGGCRAAPLKVFSAHRAERNTVRGCAAAVAVDETILHG